MTTESPGLSKGREGGKEGRKRRSVGKLLLTCSLPDAAKTVKPKETNGSQASLPSEKSMEPRSPLSFCSKRNMNTVMELTWSSSLQPCIWNNHQNEREAGRHLKVFGMFWVKGMEQWSRNTMVVVMCCQGASGSWWPYEWANSTMQTQDCGSLLGVSPSLIWSSSFPAPFRLSQPSCLFPNNPAFS